MAEDISIIKEVLAGNIESFRKILLRYEKPVISMIKNITNNHHTAEDIAQEVFFTAYKKLNTFDPARASFSTWLFTIAKNKSINALRRKKHLNIDSLPEPKINNLPSDDLIKQEQFNLLDKALNKLPLKQKTAFVLAELQNLPYEQIAQIQGSALGTIKSRINRAKKKLQKALKLPKETLV